jgi:hypothetical protein
MSPHTFHATPKLDASSIRSARGAAQAIVAPPDSSVLVFLGYRSGTRSKRIVGGDTSCGRDKQSLELLFVCPRNMGNALDAFFPSFVSMGSIGR